MQVLPSALSSLLGVDSLKDNISAKPAESSKCCPFLIAMQSAGMRSVLLLKNIANEQCMHLLQPEPLATCSRHSSKGNSLSMLAAYFKISGSAQGCWATTGSTC